jgi:hypothetical protein
MSHFVAESSGAALSAGLAEPCAAKATGAKATNARARTRLKDFETWLDMRFSSTKFRLNSTDDLVCVEHEIGSTSIPAPLQESQISILQHLQTYHRKILARYIFSMSCHLCNVFEAETMPIT